MSTCAELLVCPREKWIIGCAVLQNQDLIEFYSASVAAYFLAISIKPQKMLIAPRKPNVPMNS